MAKVLAGSPAQVAPVDEAVPASRWLLLIGLCLAAIMEVLDTSIINPVLPTMAGHLSCTTEEVAWVSTSYILANVVILPMTAWFSQRLGLKKYVIYSAIGFIVSSLFCGFAKDLSQMIFFRLLQGASGAALISMTQASIAIVFPPKYRTPAVGFWALGISVAPSMAPALGGWIADNFSWSWIFFINVPIGLISVFIINQLFPDELGAPAPVRTKPDWLGIGLLTVGLGSLQYILEEGNSKDWFEDILITRLTVTAILGCLLFVLWEMSPKNPAPIVRFSVLKDRGLSAGMILSFVIGFALYSGIFVFPIFSQRVLGFTPTKSGAFLIIPGLYLAFTMMFSGQSLSRGVAARDLSLAGMIVMVVAMWMLGHSTPFSNETDAQMGLNLRGVGIGLSILPVTTAAIASLRGADIGQGAALTGLMRQLGGSVGIAALATYISHMTDFHRYNLAANYSLGNPAVAERITGISQSLWSNGMDIEQARMAAWHLMDLQLSNQAYTRGVNNAYILTGIIVALTVPCVFLMRRSKGGAVADAH